MDSYPTSDLCGPDELAGRPWVPLPGSLVFTPAIEFSLEPCFASTYRSYESSSVDPLRSTALFARWTQELQPRGADPLPAPGAALTGVARFVGWTADLFRRHLVTPEGSVVALPAAEFMVLMAFLEEPRNVLSRDQLARRALGHPIERGARTLDVYVSRLRQRLRDEPPAQRLIATVRNRGYVFNADVVFDNAGSS